MNNPKFVIKAVLSGQRLNINVPLMASGSIAYIGIEASASPDWNDCAIICYIKKVGTDTAPSMFALTYDIVTNKHYFFANTQVTLNEGEWEIWFTGIQYENYDIYYRITTESKTFEVLRSGSYDSTVPIERPELYEQAIAIAEDARRTADEIMALYAGGQLTGPQGPEGPQGIAGQIVGVSAQYYTDSLGVPHVSVLNTGTAEQANLIFGFYNLKGDKGDRGERGPQGEQGEAGEDAPTDYILVQDEQPMSNTNVMWIKETNNNPIRMYTADDCDLLFGSNSLPNYIAPFEMDNTSAHDYAVGDYFFHDDNLCIVTSSIATGDAITVGSNCENVILCNSFNATKANKEDLLKAFPIDNAYGQIASFPDGADGIPITDIVVNIDFVQSGSGEPSPSNVRPISGWTGCDIHVSPSQDAQDGDTYSISWANEAGTVYGGTFNPITGEMLITKEMYLFDGSNDEAWSIVQGTNNYARVIIATGLTRPYVDGEIVSNLYTQGAAATNTDVINILYSIAGGVKRESIFIHPSWMTNSTTEADIRTYLASNNLQAVVTRTTPISIQLSPTSALEIKTLLGQNNVWSNTGDVSVKYHADPTLYLEAMQADFIQLGLHTMPENRGVLNVIKRCRQLTDIKWTPAVDLPRLMKVEKGFPVEDTVEEDYYLGTFKASVEYTGIPYGRTNTGIAEDYGYSYFWVGNQIRLETFVSSVSNPNSLLCKTDFGDVDKHRSTLYALVCSAFSTIAIGVPYKATAFIPTIEGLKLIGKINDNGTRLDQNLFKLGQLINDPEAHTAVITDIIKDKAGNVTFIEISEACTVGLADKNYDEGQYGGVCRRLAWPIEDIYTRWGNYNVYEYQYIKDVPYEPSPYVNAGGEPNTFHIVHFPCMPYQGEGFVFKVGNIPNTDIIISPNLGYEYLRVFKDGVEITNSPFSITSDTEKVTVGFSAAGNYEAYLSTMENGNDIHVSYPCHWKVIS